MSDQLAEFVIFFVGRAEEDGMLNDVGVGLQAAGSVAQLDVDRLLEEVVGHLTNLAKRWRESEKRIRFLLSSHRNDAHWANDAFSCVLK